MSKRTKERPIIFSAPMVRAILHGRKTQTRREMKPQPERDPSENCGVWYPKTTAISKRHYASAEHFRSGMPIDCSPYGIPGDRLWVREGFAYDDLNAEVYYRADYTDQEAAESVAESSEKWRSPIHMPRTASRITLEVENVRVERLQAISEEDAKAEGVVNHNKAIYWDPWRAKQIGPHQHEYMRLWNAINGTGSWAQNPWVWVVEFKRTTTTERSEG